LINRKRIESWWVVQTKPQGEALAIEHLHEQQGMTTYCPMFQKESIPASAGESQHHPLFPRYVFVLADNGKRQTVHTIRSNLE
jgi:transcription antitermination factor NusG